MNEIDLFSTFVAPSGSSICPTREIKVKPGSLDKMKGALYSPNLPNFYPANQKCTFTLDVPDNYKTVISFQKFSLQCKYHERNIFWLRKGKPKAKSQKPFKTSKGQGGRLRVCILPAPPSPSPKLDVVFFT